MDSTHSSFLPETSPTWGEGDESCTGKLQLKSQHGRGERWEPQMSYYYLKQNSSLKMPSLILMFLVQSRFLIELQYSRNKIILSLSGMRKRGDGFKEFKLNLL